MEATQGNYPSYNDRYSSNKPSNNRYNHSYTSLDDSYCTYHEAKAKA